MKFLSDIGRPWTTGEMEKAVRLRRAGLKIAYIARRLNRSVEEIRVVLP